MQIDILTLFPEMFSALDCSIIKRARDAGKLQINLVDFRGYSVNKHRKVDDYSFSGGAGLVICAQPVVDCVEAVDPKHEAHRIFLTPAAPVLTQNRVRAFAAKHKRLLLLCGHYEGVDQRAIDLCFDEVLSIGDYVLTGGELPAMVLTDAVARCIDGVINAESLKNESFSINIKADIKNGQTPSAVKMPPAEKTPPIKKQPSNLVSSSAEYSGKAEASVMSSAALDSWAKTGLLEHPQYTRPREFRGLTVPEVLLGGNHAEIEKWKYRASAEVTRKYRPENLTESGGEQNE